MSYDFPILPVYEALGGRVVRQKFLGWSSCHCVLHEDSRPSAQISEETNRFRCLVGCGNFDALALIQQVERLNFREALTRAKELTGSNGDGERVQGHAGGQRAGGLLPARQGHRSPRRYVPPWQRRDRG